jgi:hypothetical protein
MENRRRVVLFGNSIIVATVGTSLQCSHRYEVTTLSPAESDRLGEIHPDIILFDLEAARPEAVFSLLETQPGLMLIGVSPDSNVVKMWTGRQLRELSTKELMQAIDQQVIDTAIRPGIKRGRSTK